MLLNLSSFCSLEYVISGSICEKGYKDSFSMETHKIEMQIGLYIVDGSLHRGKISTCKGNLIKAPTKTKAHKIPQRQPTVSRNGT
jgi:hypothetical protein